MTETRHSYGIIPLCAGETGIEVLLVKQKGTEKEYWSFPKGTPEEGESPIETARREVNEEVGITFKEIDESVTFSEDYTYMWEEVTVEKTTTYYVGYVEDKAYTIQEEEIEEAAWVPVERVIERLSYPETKNLFAAVRTYLCR